jgi:transcriptional regulator with XRE-family HTH domain
MIDPDDTGDLMTDVGRRLVSARKALGLDQQQFGTRAGLSQPLYNMYENGKRLLTLQAAMKLCDEYHLTLDWLYRGDPSGLPYKLATVIRDQRRAARA